MSRPVIGVTGSVRGGLIMWLLNALSIWLAGGRPRRITARTDPSRLGEVDGFLIGGGDDISASLYQGDVTLDIRIDPARDNLEREALRIAEDRALPVLGVCRGSQMINVSRGGTLHQEVKDAYGLKKYRRTTLPRKRIELDPESRLARITGWDRFRANSLHHQSVDRLGAGMRAVGRDEHGIIQATEIEGDRFLFGVQWHPEFLFWKPPHFRIFRALVKAARERRTHAR